METLKEFKGAEELRYPGPKEGTGVIQTLASYTEHLGSINTLRFAVERNVTWTRPDYKLNPFTYSVNAMCVFPLALPMIPIKGFGPEISLTGARRDYTNFAYVARSLDSFVEEGKISFVSEKRNIRLTWDMYSLDPDSLDKSEVIDRVSQIEYVPSLDKVLNEIMPDVVSIFNMLKPGKISPEIAAKVTELAYAGDKIMPKHM